MIKKIIELITLGRFEQAKKLVVNWDSSYTELQKWAYDNENIALYTFIVSMLLEKETAKKHEMAAILFSLPFCFYKDAYSVALFHARKVLALEPNNVENKIFLILFHDIPERLIQKDEAIKIACEILEVDPSCTVALDVLKRYDVNSMENL